MDGWMEGLDEAYRIAWERQPKASRQKLSRHNVRVLVKKAREIVNPPGGQADLWKKINRTGQFQNRLAPIIFWHKIALPRGLPHKKRQKDLL